MKVVSADYKNSMAKNFRNRSYVRIYFGNVDATAATDGEWASNGEVIYSEKDTLDYKYNYGATMATLEWNRWELDGTQEIYDSNSNIRDGWLSNIMSDSTGAFSTNPTIVKTFENEHNLVGITLQFDSRVKEYPISITINTYNNNLLVTTLTQTIDNINIQIELRASNINKLEIIFNSMLPYRRSRLEHILYGIGIQYDNNDIINCKQNHDIDPISRRLPKEKFEFTILDFEKNFDADNPQGVYEYIVLKSPCSITYGYELDDGNIEWLKADNYLLSSKPTVNKNQVTFTATGLIGSLTGIYYKSKLGNKNFYDMAEDVLIDANLTLTEDGENPWEIDESLKNMYTTAVLPIDTHMNCLQLIAHACCCKLYTDDNNIIHIEPFVIDSLIKQSFSINFDNTFENSEKFTKIDELKAVTVAKTVYTTSNNSATLHESTTTETTMHIELSQLASNITINVSNGTVVSSEIYGRAIDLELSSGTKTVTITGYPIDESNIVYTYNYNNTGEIDVEENPLLTDDTMCANLASHISSYLQFKNTYDVDYRGNPELETGDVINLQTSFSQNLTSLVLTDEINFNGSLKGHLKLKSII